ncbi:MAG: carboxymuconolactone decarboxylase family protein [Methanomicrobiales archaeon]|nr:carboxymuconolactone decarboxylase family protein [Methanomicrobiales archaeon]
MEFEDTLEKIVERGTQKTAEDWLKAINVEYGKVPLIFERMAERPEVLISHLLYKSAITKTSKLDPKVVELISLAVGASLKCRHCVSYHIGAALKKGATRDEILEVILIAGLTANAAVLANAYRVMHDTVHECGGTCDVDGVHLEE